MSRWETLSSTATCSPSANTRTSSVSRSKRCSKQASCWESRSVFDSPHFEIPANPFRKPSLKAKPTPSKPASGTEGAEILAARWDKLPEGRRPHYSPRQRFRILWLKSFFAWSRQEAADVFRLAPATITRWENEGIVDNETQTIGSLLKPGPPVRRFADVVRHLVQDMAGMGFGGSRRIAQTLARAGWKLSRRTVQRILEEKRPPPQPDNLSQTEIQNEPDEPASKARVLTAKPNHIWMLDITEVPALFRICSFKLAVALDVFSRMPLAFRVFCKEPSAQQIFQLYQHAFRYGKPRHTVTDQGSQFTAKIFTDGLETLDIKQRFGAIGTYGSIAIIERLWRTLKELLLLKRLRPLVQHELEHRVRLGLDYYAHHRPHQGLAGATPAEVFFRKTPAHTEAISPPRARPGRGPRGSPFEVEFFDPEQRLPLLVKKTA